MLHTYRLGNPYRMARPHNRTVGKAQGRVYPLGVGRGAVSPSQERCRRPALSCRKQREAQVPSSAPAAAHTRQCPAQCPVPCLPYPAACLPLSLAECPSSGQMSTPDTSRTRPVRCPPGALPPAPGVRLAAVGSADQLMLSRSGVGLKFSLTLQFPLVAPYIWRASGRSLSP
jgi:hypothetical protein